MNFDQELDSYLESTPTAPKKSAIAGFGTAAVAAGAIFGATDASAAIVPFGFSGAPLSIAASNAGAIVGGSPTMPVMATAPVVAVSSFSITGSMGGMAAGTAVALLFGRARNALSGTGMDTVRSMLAVYPGVGTTSNPMTGTLFAMIMPASLGFSFMVGAYTGWLQFGSFVVGSTVVNGTMNMITAGQQLNTSFGTGTSMQVVNGFARVFGGIETVPGAGVTVGSFAGAAPPPAVPEPGTTALAALALGALGVVELRRRKKKQA